MAEYKRRRGDRRDARWVRDVPGLTTIMTHIMPKRTAAEVYVNEKIDATELLKFIEQKNLQHPEYRTTLFHCFVVAIARMIRERPKMNRFIQGRIRARSGRYCSCCRSDRCRNRHW